MLQIESSGPGDDPFWALIYRRRRRRPLVLARLSYEPHISAGPRVVRDRWGRGPYIAWRMDHWDVWLRIGRGNPIRLWRRYAARYGRVPMSYSTYRVAHGLADSG